MIKPEYVENIHDPDFERNYQKVSESIIKIDSASSSDIAKHLLKTSASDHVREQINHKIVSIKNNLRTESSIKLFIGDAKKTQSKKSYYFPLIIFAKKD